MPRYDVFLSYPRKQSAAVEGIARKLHDRRLAPWFDRWRLVPGVPWQQAIERALKQSETCAVFIGPDGLGPVQREESWIAISQRFGDPAFRVIPVLLPGVDRPTDDQLPGLLRAATWVQFQRVDDAESLRLLECGIRGVEPGPATTIPLADVKCPYVGMRAFAEDDWPVFFGRTAWTSRLVERLRERIGGPAVGARRVRRLMGVLGPSGSGKSSLVLAGLLPALRQGKISGSETWPIVTLRPGSHPLESLAKPMADLLGVPGTDVGEVVKMTAALVAHPESLHLLASRLLKDAPDRKLVVVVDQFEEAFTVCATPELRDAFIACLLEAAGRTDGSVVVVLTLRADFYGHCAPYEELARELSEGHDLIGPMTDDELREAVEAPARHVGCEVEASLVDALVKDASQDRTGSLPLLADVLFTLWEKRKDRTIRYDSFDAARGLVGALADRADSLFRALPNPEQDACPSLFDRLVAAGDGTRETKRRVERRSLSGLRGDILTPGGLVDRLVGARLLVADAGEGGRDSGTLEIAHEALIRSWPKLQEWVRHDPESRRLRELITAATGEWVRSRRDRAFLLTGARLVLAADWARRQPECLADREHEFLRACQSRATRARRQRIIFSFGVVVLALAVAILGTKTLVANKRLSRVAELELDLSWLLRARLAARDLFPTDARSVEQYQEIRARVLEVKDRLQLRGQELWERQSRGIDSTQSAPGSTETWANARQEIELLSQIISTGGEVFNAKGRDTGAWDRLELRFHSCMPDDAAQRWERARERMSRAGSVYEGFDLPEQFGLCPLGPDSGPEHLEEFAYVFSGDLPNRIDGVLSELPYRAIVLVLVPGGEFQLGSPGPTDADDDHHRERPQHLVRVKPFFLAKCECTLGQWWRLAGVRGNGSIHPATVARANWSDPEEPDAVFAHFGLVLPSEAQWEYACRARTATEWPFGDDSAMLERYAWIDSNGRREVRGGSDLLPNSWGFYNMLGNVEELCSDDFHSDYRGRPKIDDSPWCDVPRSECRVVRGGSSEDSLRSVHSACRGAYCGGQTFGLVGFRPARSIRIR